MLIPVDDDDVGQFMPRNLDWKSGWTWARSAVLGVTRANRAVTVRERYLAVFQIKRGVLQGVLDAKTTDSTMVSDAMRRMKYDFYKGPEYYRQCDHQAVQSVLIIESKSKGNRDKNDVFNIVSTDAPSEANLRSCAELGHKT